VLLNSKWWFTKQNRKKLNRIAIVDGVGVRLNGSTPSKQGCRQKSFQGGGKRLDQAIASRLSPLLTMAD